MSNFLPPQGLPVEGLPPPNRKVDALGSVAVEGKKETLVGTYENGWGFFDEGEALNPKEFIVTRNDDLYVASHMLGLDRKSEFSDVDRRLPLSPGRRKIAEEGICRAIEAKMQLAPGSFTNVHEARNFLQQTIKDNPDYLRSKDAIYFQGISMMPSNGSDLGDYVEGHGDFLHFGRSSRSIETAKDKLDDVVRVYVHTPPEFNGHIAAQLIQEVRDKLGRELYLKLDDCSTSNRGTARTDTLIVYGQTHGELAVVAELLRQLANEHPEMFDDKANPIDLARQTAIPGVSIAEEPQQDGVMQESFNSSRQIIEQTALKAVYKKILEENPEVVTAYGISKEDIEYFPHVKGQDAVRDIYGKMGEERQALLREQLKGAYRREVRKLLEPYGIDPNNFAMNKRTLHR